MKHLGIFLLATLAVVLMVESEPQDGGSIGAQGKKEVQGQIGAGTMFGGKGEVVPPAYDAYDDSSSSSSSSEEEGKKKKDKKKKKKKKKKKGRKLSDEDDDDDDKDDDDDDKDDDSDEKEDD